MRRVSTQLAYLLPPFHGRRGGFASEVNLAETRLHFRFYALGLTDDAVKGGGLFLEFRDVSWLGHGDADDGAILSTP